MDIKQMVLIMYPYWIIGILIMLATVFAGQKEALRVEKPALIKWVKFLGILTVYRIILFSLFPNFSLFRQAHDAMSIIPWPMTLTVFWEDACHGLPLYLLKKLIGKNKWGKYVFNTILVLVMIAFGLGHVYQGAVAAIMLSFYIPYSIKLGEKYGFGTVMIGHSLFDLTTILAIRFLLGG
jgi:hypothetical protein